MILELDIFAFIAAISPISALNIVDFLLFKLTCLPEIDNESLIFAPFKLEGRKMKMMSKNDVARSPFYRQLNYATFGISIKVWHYFLVYRDIRISVELSFKKNVPKLT